jgi:uncharacterized protein YdeI (YjbR/CyaY-like superfamily)
MGDSNILYSVKIMTQNRISAGVVHSVPMDWRKALIATPQVRVLWEDITPLARNEWICWILDAKKSETRVHRIEVGLSKLKSGMRRPCCWAGCSHR